MSGINKVILIGRLGKDPEVRAFEGGTKKAFFTLATSEIYKDKEGKKVEQTEWHNIVLYRQLAEIAQQYLTKGKEVYIEGRIQSRKYTGKDGIERTSYEIIGESLQMLGGRADNAGADNYAPASAPRKTEPRTTPLVDDLDDDIPFN